MWENFIFLLQLNHLVLLKKKTYEKSIFDFDAIPLID